VVVLAGLAAGTAVAGTHRAAGRDASGGTWGKAEPVPGLAALNTGGQVYFNSLSCASAGNCSAGGSYADSSDSMQAFVVSQAGGTWRKAKEVAAVLNTGGNAEVYSVSCATPGNCTTGGYYYDSSGNDQGFVVSKVGGTWRRARQVPRLAALNTSGDAQVISVSCAAANHCSAGGTYTDKAGNVQAFVVSKT
jgi:hypothetical protein